MGSFPNHDLALFQSYLLLLILIFHDLEGEIFVKECKKLEISIDNLVNEIALNDVF